MQEQLAVDVKDSAFDPDATGHTILVRNKSADQPLYRVFLYLDGPDLPFVDSVQYELHPTFTNPTRTVSRTPANPRCKLEIWTWGLFQVTATIRDRKGRTHVRYRDLQYDKEFQAEGVKFQAA